MASLFESNTAQGNATEFIEMSKKTAVTLASMLQQDIDVESLFPSKGQSGSLYSTGAYYSCGCGGALFIDLTSGAAAGGKADVMIASSNFSTNGAGLGGGCGQPLTWSYNFV